ncbi:MAG: hypothetical protein LKF37_09010 [Lentilactobacillus diolivorans]|jgi:hypothetical protein|nr:hypothetical protein [Lentilactobacillus diolivorans]RRG02454.1 MAG: hypothetical protein DUD34_08170 [Lactobacillus sp.]
MLKKITLSFAIGIALFTSSTIAANASTDLGNNENIQYVKVKKPTFTGQYTKVNDKKGHRIITPKGTILKVLGTTGSTAGSQRSQAVFSLGQISYAKQQRIYQPKNGVYIRNYNTTYFKPYSLKLPMRSQFLQLGQYANNGSEHYKPIFVVTMDGYLQYYSQSRLKHYRIQNNMSYGKQGNGGPAVDNPLFKIKPTRSIKVNRFLVKGKHYYLYYRTPVKGLAEKKVSKTNYRLTIRQLTTIGKTWHSGEDFFSARWTNYNVGGHRFFYLGDVESGD